MKKRKILVTTGTRAEYGILRPILHAISKSKKLKLYLVVTGTHLSKKHGLTINEIKNDGFKIFRTIKVIPEKDTKYASSKSLGDTITAFSKIFLRVKPDINLIIGDRDEMFASAIAAYHMNIPNAHIHGGDKSGGIDEYTRHAITKISNIHFAATTKSKERIIRMGEDTRFVFLTGSPSIDEIVNNRITNKKDLETKYNITFRGNEILLLYHPVTTEVEKTERQIRNILDAVVKIRSTTIAILPNSDAGNKIIFQYLKSYSQKYDFIKTYATLPRYDYLGMLRCCGVLLGNSSSGMIEASYFDIPVVNIGIRQENRERGKNILDVKKESVNSIYLAILESLKRKNSKRLSTDHAYGKGNAAEKIVYYLENIVLNSALIQKQISY